MMSTDDAKQPLLKKPGTCPNLNEKFDIQRRRLLRCGSAPAEIISPELNENESQPGLSEDSEVRFKQILMFLAAYLGAGTVCFFLIMNQIEGVKTNGILDAIYFSVVTMTTVGYGDLVPHTTLAKLLACIYVFTGMAMVGLILGKAADYLVEKQEIVLVRAMYKMEKAGSDEVLKVVETHKVKYKLLTATIILLVLITVGTLFLAVVENLQFIDAFYCVCSTITTLGYGDQSFSTGIGRLFAAFWILSSTICLAQFFLYLTELYTEKRQKSIIKWVLTRQLTLSDLESADLDHDKSVSAAEFVVYKLKEMGKISGEDVSLLVERFRILDADQSGTLTAADINLTQSSRK
ncbi:Two-pore potassium channel like [Melia azedarach]|uniref:Two-pore potassium channel like n=1 Tax=Melia azedarach TaxID=155640 RepID=A0ACC1WYC0_MELAZ|nr:Two-pore potassium channel like [Melia azedarach]